jgi:hypothetical protein
MMALRQLLIGEQKTAAQCYADNAAYKHSIIAIDHLL